MPWPSFYMYLLLFWNKREPGHVGRVETHDLKICGPMDVMALWVTEESIFDRKKPPDQIIRVSLVQEDKNKFQSKEFIIGLRDGSWKFGGVNSGLSLMQYQEALTHSTQIHDLGISSDLLQLELFFTYLEDETLSTYLKINWSVFFWLPECTFEN